jgi:phosphohistidine phosphatase
MLLYLIRHGDALPAEGGPDAFRLLSAEGRKSIAALGRTLAKEKVRWERVVSSPLGRAVQTAEIVAAAARDDGAIEWDTGLLPDADPVTIARHLETLADESVALVGHEPHLGRLATVLLGRPFPGFKKGQVLCVEVSRDRVVPRFSLAAGAGKPERLS